MTTISQKGKENKRVLRFGGAIGGLGKANLGKVSDFSNSQNKFLRVT